MKKWLFVACSAILVLPSRAQILDSFSDGDFSSNPPWMGLTGLFTVENETLRLKDPDPASSNTAWLYLDAPTSMQEETTWEWYVKLDFDPSASNYARIYLQASLPELAHPEQKGYFLRIGGASGATDALELFRQDGASQTLLLSGTLGAMALQPAQARFRVVRTVEGGWTLWADYAGGTDFQPEGTATDSTYRQGGYMGLACYYTSSRSDDFYFDDLLADPLYADLAAPSLLFAQAGDAYHVRAFFDEPLDEASALDPGRYQISPDIGQPEEVSWEGDQPDQVLLALPFPLENGGSYTLHSQGLADDAGNESGPQTAFFTYQEGLPGEPYDLLLTEVMADPVPAVGLPEVEYLEVFNRSAGTLDLEGWTVSDGGSPSVFSAYFLPPQQFLLLCAPEDTTRLKPYGAVLGIPGFPGLNNSGDKLSLNNASGVLIQQVEYVADWYGESGKDDGGWSLELINPLAPCAEISNWRASEHLLGGTPGQANSVWQPVADVEGPVLRGVFPGGPFAGKVFFGEALSPETIQASQFAISGGVVVTHASVSGGDPRVAELEWEPALGQGIIYELSAGSGIADCLGNPGSSPQTVAFGLPGQPEAGGVVINEILFQPETGGAEFVEVYNRSGQVVNLGDLLIGNIQGSSDSIEPVGVDWLLLPGVYAAICERPADLYARFATARAGLVVKNALPAMPDQGGNLTLYAEGAPGEAVVLDAVDYGPEWHHPLLHTTRGVSLERIDPDGPGQAASNWHSAAASAGYGTPGAENSQHFRVPEQEGEKTFSAAYQIFSPDGDGERDYWLLSYEMERNGFTASVLLFDAMGRLVKELARNELLATSGSFRWDGDDHNGGKARTGIYIAWVRLLHPDGEVREEKHVCVLAGR